MAASGFEQLAGQRVGLITSASSMLGEDRLVDVLAARPDVELALIFAPEHGFAGTAERGTTVETTIDVDTGVEILSLYGSSRSPSADILRDRIDVMVFDLQDVGARPYTYLSTMGLAMQAAAAADVDFLVLDRPNPAGGTQLGGPVRAPDVESFIAQYPVPLQHGLTAGEMAQAIVGEGWLPGLGELRLAVVLDPDWHREDMAGASDWTPPSPALTTSAAGLAYPGMVLFEATSVSYGRGTDLPFQVVGAPWLEPADALSILSDSELPGVTFAATTITPRDPSDPNHDQTVPAVQLAITEADMFRPVLTATTLLTVMRDLGAESGAAQLIENPQLFDLLAGDRRFRESLDGGASSAELNAQWEAGLAEFDNLRRPYLLYPE